MRVIVIASIQQVIVAILLTAGNRNRTGAGVIVTGGNAARRIGRDGGAAGEQDQIGGLPPVQREIDNPALVHDFGNRRVLRLHHGRIGGHLDLLRYRSHLKRDVDLDIVRHLEDNPGLSIKVLKFGAETCKVYGPDGQVRKHIGTRAITL